MTEKDKKVRPSLPLSDELAVERTRLANERTLLAYIRTGMYFSVAGITLESFFQLKYGWLIALVFWLGALLIVVSGIIRYSKVKRKLTTNALIKKHWHLLIEEEV